MEELIAPHGGRLVDLIAPPDVARETKARAAEWPSWTLTARQQCDIELLASGAYSPLAGFLNQADWQAVTTQLRLSDDTLWPMPITLDVPRDVAEAARRSGHLGLRDLEGQLVAVVTVADMWEPDRLEERGDHVVTLLDGDIVRRDLSSELGFSEHDRNLNIQRIGFVAAELTRAGAWVICAPIAPYDKARKAVRQEISGVGGFTLIHVSTPLEICESRDSKGLYARARKGEIPAFTGISDPYEPPEDAELSIDTSQLRTDQGVRKILEHLEREGYLLREQ